MIIMWINSSLDIDWEELIMRAHFFAWLHYLCNFAPTVILPYQIVTVWSLCIYVLVGQLDERIDIFRRDGRVSIRWVNTVGQ